MSQLDKKLLWDALKARGVEFPKHYREYTTAELQAAVDHMQHQDDLQREQAAAAVEARDSGEFLNPDGIPYAGPGPDYMVNTDVPLNPPPPYQPQVREADELAGVRLNQPEYEALRTDPETGFIWYVDEVRKPANAQPRGRRVLRYLDPGVRVMETKSADGFVETFEVPGESTGREMEAKITLPSYQVGIYSDPQFPFKIHVYNDQRGFDFFEVNDFYGGPDMVPQGVKRMYVSSDLCYDMRTTIREIESEYREKVLGRDRIA